MRRRTQDQPSTNETVHRKNPAGDAVPGSQDSITRCFQNRQLADVPCPTSGDPINNVHVTNEIIFGVLSVALIPRPVSEVQILVSWGMWCISTAASL